MTAPKTPVFLLKTKSTPHDGYEEYFSASGHYEPSFVPVLEHRFRDASLRRVRDLFVSGEIGEQYGGLIFTSQRAVEGFSRIIREEVGETASTKASTSLHLYTVGPATYRSLNTLCESHLPHSQIIGHDAGTGEKLAHVILDHYNANHHRRRHRLRAGTGTINDHNGAREVQNGNADADADVKSDDKLPLLFLIGEQHRDIIPKTLMAESLAPERRIEVEELVVYETGVMESFEEMFARALRDARERRRREREREESEGDGDGDERAMWVVVFSPTGCEAMLRTLGVIPRNGGNANGLAVANGDGDEEGKKRMTAEALRDCYIATIGPTTRDHLREKFGVEPDVCADIPSPQGIGEGIKRFLAERNGC
ncbi:hypothetical protein AJ79_05466 [Helicocarpus griseus UAMH5409]|uniref:Tetrapyrrole biosynthesis uroporphyrinogen III synthase domain-containing protein n=1 Tax=Helicocarpus griseus UAMH5409 TaxID=1447875 RepID=A0A2B7XNI2_9EURO|nr:hypothetical protein AJ79_05466 [Helicocarpus griseus UAMH5409]